MRRSDQLELEIFRLLTSSVPSTEARDISLRAFAHEIGCRDTAELVDAFKRLAGYEHVTLDKYNSARNRFVKYGGEDDNAFFYRDSFRGRITPLGRTHFEMLEEEEEKDQAKRDEGDGPLVFISCGQYTKEEIRLGKEVAQLIEDLTGFEGYFAQNQDSLEGLSHNIFKALDRCVGFVAIMHHRGDVSTLDGNHTRASVWIEQEIAIAAFLVQAQRRDLAVRVYIQKGVKREGVREQLRLDPMEFNESSEVLQDLRTRIDSGKFKVFGAPRNPSR